jgi:hypothetical protein
MAVTKRSVSLPLPALTTRQAEAVIDALNSVVGQLWDAYGEDIRMMYAWRAERDLSPEDRELAPPLLEDDPPW